jgi:Na+/H+-translocating membrane pyrophosphatase
MTGTRIAVTMAVSIAVAASLATSYTAGGSRGLVIAGTCLAGASSWWIVLTEMGAAVAAVLVALPRAATRSPDQRPVQ